MWEINTLTDPFFRKPKGSKNINPGPHIDDYFWCLNLPSGLSGHFGMRKLRVVETTLTPWLQDCEEVALNNVFLVHTVVHTPSNHQPQEPWTMLV